MARHRKSDPRWRGTAAAEVMAEAIEGLDLGARVLLAGEAHADVVDAVSSRGASPSLWLRRAGVPGDMGAGYEAAREWPQGAPYSSALIRLPRGKDELEMMLHAAAAGVVEGGIIGVYGANDEGIKSAAGRMEPLLGPVGTVAQRAHCRALVARRPAVLAGLKGRLADWRRETRIAIGGLERPWVSYPGTFAGGVLDAGTQLLLAALTGEAMLPDAKPLKIADGIRVLDFACGTGVVAAHIAQHLATVDIVMADHDALAIRAAIENVPGARGVIATNVRQVISTATDASASRPARGYDLIVSNPPIHDGKAEDYTVLGQLIAQAPEVLAAGGTLVLVIQARVPAEPWLSAAFSDIALLARDPRYHVWRASGPRLGKSRPTRTASR